MNCKICGKRIMQSIDGLCNNCLGSVPNIYEMNLLKGLGEYFASSSMSDYDLGKNLAKIIIINIEMSKTKLKLGFFEEFLKHINITLKEKDK